MAGIIQISRVDHIGIRVKNLAHVSVFVRDPDLNVVELRGREKDLSSLGGVTAYKPEN